MTEAQAETLIGLVTVLMVSLDLLLWWVVFGVGLFVGFALFWVCMRTISRSLYQW
jgi:hypothetical protein